jgi:hypothetical protein
MERNATALVKVEAGRYRLGKYLIVHETRLCWRAWCMNFDPTLNTIAERRAAETELEGLPTLKEAVAYVRREMRDDG